MKNTGYNNDRLKRVLIYAYNCMQVTSMFSNLKDILVSYIHYIRHAGYKNLLDIRTLYAIPNDVLISAIHCIRPGYWLFIFGYHDCK